MTDRILSRQFHGAEGAEAWRVLPDGAYAFFRTDSFSTAARFVEAISGLVRDGNDPSIDIRGDGVTVLIRAFKGRDFGLVQSDLDLAHAISTAAREIGLTAEPAAIQSLSIIPGASDRGGIMPFWQAVLGYDRRPDSPDEDLVVWVPCDEAESRVAAGLAAGGRMVRHNVEENFWTLADPAGNEVDVATTSAPAPDQAK
jgi:4a-hydroxytetrahydrobiopterin dehydratase